MSQELDKLLINAKIHTVAGRDYDNGFIHIQGQRILAVGEMADCPSFKEDDTTKVVDLSGLSVYPGFIDAHCHIGMWEDGLGFEGADGNEETDPVTAELRGIDGVNPQDRCFTEALEAGVTTVVTGPGSANPIGGTLCCMHCNGDFVNDMIIAEPIAMKMALGENPKGCYHEKKRAPETRMATVSIIRNALSDAIVFDNNVSNNKKGNESRNAKSEALTPVAKGKLAAHIHAHRIDDIFTAVRIAEEFDLNLTVVHGTEGYMQAKRLAEMGVDIILGPIMSDRSKPELKNLTAKAAGVLEKEGVRFAICTDHPVIPIQYLPITAGIAVREGLSPATAIKAITTIPAEILGLSDKIGSITPGLYADLAIYKSSPLSLEGRCEMTFVKGEIVYSRS